MPLGEEPPGVGQQDPQEFVFELCELHRRTPNSYSVIMQIYRQVAHREDWYVNKAFPEQRGSDALEQPGGRTWFGEIVVRASVKGGNLVGLGVTDRKDEYGELERTSEKTYDLNTIHVGKAKIEYDGVQPRIRCEVQGLAARRRFARRVTASSQPCTD